MPGVAVSDEPVAAGRRGRWSRCRDGSERGDGCDMIAGMSTCRRWLLEGGWIDDGVGSTSGGERPADAGGRDAPSPRWASIRGPVTGSGHHNIGWQSSGQPPAMKTVMGTPNSSSRRSMI
jgi:hypothetical protein